MGKFVWQSKMAYLLLVKHLQHNSPHFKINAIQKYFLHLYRNAAAEECINKQNILMKAREINTPDLNQLVAMKHWLKKRKVISREEQSHILTCWNKQKTSHVLD